MQCQNWKGEEGIQQGRRGCRVECHTPSRGEECLPGAEGQPGPGCQSPSGVRRTPMMADGLVRSSRGMRREKSPTKGIELFRVKRMSKQGLGLASLYIQGIDQLSKYIKKNGS